MISDIFLLEKCGLRWATPRGLRLPTKNHSSFKTLGESGLIKHSQCFRSSPGKTSGKWSMVPWSSRASAVWDVCQMFLPVRCYHILKNKNNMFFHVVPNLKPHKKSQHDPNLLVFVFFWLPKAQVILCQSFPCGTDTTCHVSSFPQRMSLWHQQSCRSSRCLQGNTEHEHTWNHFFYAMPNFGKDSSKF